MNKDDNKQNSVIYEELLKSKNNNKLYKIKPYGRLGNRLTQIANMLYFCEETGANCLVPETIISREFYLFDSKVSTQIEEGRFFYKEDFDVKDYYNCRINQEKILKKYLLPNLKFELKEPLPADVAVVHVRSGDIMSRIIDDKKSVHGLYIQGPLSYCQYFTRKFSKCYMVTEPDMLNPVIKPLLDESNIELVNCDLVDNIKLLLSARNIISTGVSSFAFMFAKLNPFLEKYICINFTSNIHTFTQDFDSINSKAETVVYNTRDTKYIEHWCCTPDQLQMMIDHKFDESKISRILPKDYC